MALNLFVSGFMRRIDHIPRKKVSMEKICSMLCLAAAVGFLVAALFGAWRFFFLSAICLAASAIVGDEDRSRH